MSEHHFPPARKRGRPLMDPGEKKRITMTFRVTVEARNRLAEAAEARGCSMSEEIERRLALSHDAEDIGSRVVAFIKSELPQGR